MKTSTESWLKNSTDKWIIYIRLTPVLRKVALEILPIYIVYLSPLPEKCSNILHRCTWAPESSSKCLQSIKGVFFCRNQIIFRPELPGHTSKAQIRWHLLLITVENINETVAKQHRHNLVAKSSAVWICKKSVGAKFVQECFVKFVN